MKKRTADAKKHALSLDDVAISVKWEIDENPDLSHLGEYSDKPEEGAIDRQALGDSQSEEYRYWNPENHKKFDPKNWDHVSGKDKAMTIRKHGSLRNAEAHYRMEDYKRHEAFNNNEWWMEVCVVTVRIGALKAEASCCGVESDAGEDHRKEIASSVTYDALAELKKKVMSRLECE